jgi:type I restriction enzyme S subunit
MDRKVWGELFQPYSVYGGELLITKLGEPPGDCAIYPNGIGPAMVTPDVIKFSADSSLVDSKYLMYFFNSETSRKALEDIAFGTTRPRITLPIFKKLRIPYCSKVKQQQIVEEIESRFSVCDKIEETIADSLKQAEALRQSILKKAFDGKLV